MKHELDIFTIRHLLERSAKRHGKRLALSLIGQEKDQLTYEQLLQRVDSVATYLMKIGVQQGEKIALLGENHPNWVIAYLAIVSAGAVAVPILPDFSSFEIGHILSHSKSKALFVSSRLFEKTLPFSSEAEHLLVRIDDLFHIPAPVSLTLNTNVDFTEAPGKDMAKTKANLKNLEKRFTEEDELVSIIYTSGTTGSSKAVMLSNKNLCSNASASTRQFFKVRSGMRFLSILPLSHSYEFTIGFLLPLTCGCEIHYLGKAPAASLLLPALKKIKPHVMLSVPLLIEKIYRSSVLPQINNNPKISRLYHKKFFRKFINSVIGKKLVGTFGGRLKFFGVGGAALEREVEQFLKESKFPYAIGYGLTETSPLLAGSGPKQTKVGSVGPPLKGVQLRIAGDGVGEIEALGPNVMLGYYQNDELNSQSFTPDGWFKTGDLGEIIKGRLYLRGRSKTMILGPGGENIYPEIIESLINNRTFVQESLVFSDEEGLAALIKLDLELMAESLKISATEAKERALFYLSSLREEINKELSSFSRIRRVELQDEPFQRTPTLKIKRYLYNLKKGISGDKKEKKE